MSGDGREARMGPRGDHFYTADANERDNAVNNLGFVAEGTAFWGLPPGGGTSGGRGPLYRLFHPGRFDHFYTMSVPERANAINALGYKDEGIVADIYSAAAAGRVPVYRAYAAGSGDHFYTTSKPEHDAAVASGGYVSEGIAGYAFPAAAAGRIPVFRAYKRYGARLKLHIKIVQNYVAEGSSGFVFGAAGAGRTPLLRAYHPASGDHFYTVSASEHQNAVANLGYVNEGTACWVPAASAAGAIPLLRSFNPQVSDHFYTTSAAEHQNAVSHLGYVNEGVACHVFAANQAGTTPFFRMYNAEVSDHFYTISAVERTNAQQNPGPNISTTTMLTAMQNTYDQAGIQVVLASTQLISAPGQVDVDVGNCTMGNTTADQAALFSHRDFIGANEVVVYFVRATVPAFNGCAAHPNGKPGAVVAQGATQWTMAHEVGHVLGLVHVNNNTRLMTGNGTANITTNPPVLIASEITTMDNSPLTVNI
jgi:hypothetical protein